MSRKVLRRLGAVVLLLIVMAAAAGFWAWQRYTGFADAPLPGIESGDANVSLNTLDRIAETLKVTFADLVKPLTLG
mgnify:CR=1 FL=1